ncbi:MAG: helicase-exonuclease AddAB subunit AddA [Oscillospiraceae bacterium]|nr:helicase-exonuclease AddAB subunit AddA [Oscillospiraceae bacterium]
MAEIRPTAAQQAAIDARGSAVLISAGAGSGKTRVLTERLLARLCDRQDPVDLDRFLIITFTRAAAGELRGRIGETLAAALAAEPGDRRLRRQSALVRRAQIGTIHGFCAAFLREHGHRIGVSPDFAILDEQRGRAMKADAMERVLDACYEHPEAHPGFLLLADTVGAGRDDRRLAELALELHEKMQCHARPALWAQRQVEAMEAPAADVGETVWGREILRSAAETVSYWSAELDRSIALIAAEPAIAKAWLQGFQDSSDALRRLLAALEEGWEPARACFPIPFKMGTLRKSPDPALSESLKARRTACKQAMEKLEDVFVQSSRELLADQARTASAMRALLDLVRAFDKAYTAAKRRAELLDYADLEHLTAQLLTQEDGSPSELALQVRPRWAEIMVDEYQDVSKVQDDIFRAVSRDERDLFLVGDVKQSIYRFRLADPGNFTRRYESYADYTDAAPGEPRRILLRENFRSRREILDAANAVFSRCMSRALGDIDYDEAAALRFGAVGYEGSVPVPALSLLRLDAGGEEEAPDKVVQEAALVAGEIRALMAEGVRVAGRGGPRPLDYGDIAILLRSANNVGPVYRRELARAGIPVGFGQGGGFFRAAEVSVVMSTLALLDDPHQDIPLIAVLRSPALGFDADALSAIRAADREGDLYTALCAWSQDHPRGAEVLERLDRLRRQAPDLRAAQLVEQILEELDLLSVCSAMTDGEQRRARLMGLVELSERFEATGYRGLHRFVLWLRRMAEKGQEPSLGAESGSAVHILSIHKSKGLEFPVVFLCDLARSFNRQDLRAAVLIHPELGLGPKVCDRERRVEYPSYMRRALALRMDRESLSEELRLLYVGMTRARERLFLCAAVKDPDTFLEKARNMADTPIAPALLARAQSPAVWLAAAALADGQRHLQIRIREPDARREEAVAAASAEPDPETLRELRRQLAFVYPHRAAEQLPSKVTATELKDRAEPDADAVPLAPRPHRPFRLPDFVRDERPLTGAERGTATHLVLQYMDFARTGSREEILGEIRRLQEARSLSAREAQAVDAEAIRRLFASPLGRRILAAPKLRREFKFSLLCDAGDLFPEAAGAGEQVLLQGVVDCFLEDEDGITVIDYKTDRVRSRAEAEERARVYAPQLRAYAGALERICEKPVKERLLYFLNAGETVAVEP